VVLELQRRLGDERPAFPTIVLGPPPRRRQQRSNPFAAEYIAAKGQAPRTKLLVAESQKELYEVGALYTGFLMLLSLVVGTSWSMLVTR
jgi:hypothetical protein